MSELDEGELFLCGPLGSGVITASILGLRGIIKLRCWFAGVSEHELDGCLLRCIKALYTSVPCSIVGPCMFDGRLDGEFIRGTARIADDSIIIINKKNETF